MVLELTLKHVKTLSTLLEQQQQKIIALQKDLQIGKLVTEHQHERSTICCIDQNNFRENCAAEMILKHVVLIDQVIMEATARRAARRCSAPAFTCVQKRSSNMWPAKKAAGT